MNKAEKEIISKYASNLGKKSWKIQSSKMTKKEYSAEMSRRRLEGIKNKKI